MMRPYSRGNGGEDLAGAVDDLGVEMLIAALDDESGEIAPIEDATADSEGTFGLSGVGLDVFHILGGSLRGGFAGFTSNNFVGIANTLAFVGFRFTQSPDVGGNLTDELFVDAGNFDFVVALDVKRDAGDGLEGNRVTEAERENEISSRGNDAITGTDELELFGETVANPDDGIVGEGTAEAVIGAGKFVFAVTIKFQMGSLDLGRNFFRQSNDKIPLGSGDVEFSVFDFDFDGLG